MRLSTRTRVFAASSFIGLILVAVALPRDAQAQNDVCWTHTHMSYAPYPWFGSPQAACTDRLRVSLLPHWGCVYFPDPSAFCNNYQAAYPVQSNALCELPGIAPNGTTRVDSTPLFQSPCNRPVPPEDQTQCRNNPVLAGSGIKIHSETDYRAANSRLQFRRAYRSAFPTGPYGPVADMGLNWLHESSRRLLAGQIGGIYYQFALRPDGSIGRFSANTVNSATWTPDYATKGILRPVLDAGNAIVGFKLYPSDELSVESYDGKGVLNSIAFADGATLTFEYSTTSTPPSVAPRAGLLIQVRDQFGRQVGLIYDVASGRPSQLLPPGAVANAAAGSVNSPIRYRHDEALSLGPGVTARGQLTSVTWQDGSVRRYHYENSQYPLALSGITDELAARTATYTYQADGRAAVTERAGGQARVQYSYSEGLTTEIDPRGTVRALGVVTTSAVTQRGSSSQPAGSGSAQCSDSYTYDVQGNVASRTDFNGNKTCFAYDLARNLETKRVEGLSAAAVCSTVLISPPAGDAVRTITTQWNPDWRLESRRAEPKRIVTSVYNGQPDPTAGNAISSCAPVDALVDGKPIAVLCKQVEQATSDATGGSGFGATAVGVARVSQRTYNRWGQVLTANGPRIDLTDLTTYEYYPDTQTDWNMGDLKQLTNALGQIARFTKYDRYGRLLEKLDANNTKTEYRYSPRSWLTQVKVTPAGASSSQITVYEYDGVGQMTKATLPDGSFTRYTYDAAQRLTNVEDSAGNKVEYTLDVMGNRTREDWKDAGGVLRKTLTRTIDALNRVQQVVGGVQ